MNKPFTGVSIFILLVASSLTFAQGRLKNNLGKRPTAHAAKPAAMVSNESFESPTGKLAVNGMHTGVTGILQIHIDSSLKGPVVITVSNNGQIVKQGEERAQMVELQLTRATEYSQKVDLADGENVVQVSDLGDSAEKVTFPWRGEVVAKPITRAAAPTEVPEVNVPTATAPAPAPETKDAEAAEKPRSANSPPADPPASPGDNQLEESAGGNVSASVKRIKDKVSLNFHITDRVKDLKVQFLDESEKELFSRSFNDFQRGTNDWSVNNITLPAGAKTTRITANLLRGGTDSLDLDVPEEAKSKPAQNTATATEDPPEYDWGRVRGYFAGGVVFSKEREDFSKSDIFLDFTLDKNYFGRKHLDVNTFFNARLTSVPVTAKDTTEDGSGGGEGTGEDAEPCNTPDCAAFITSKKAAMMQAGIYVPMYADFMTWKRFIPRPNGPKRLERNALFVGPLAKGGILTVTGDRETAEAKQFGADDVFNFFSIGAILGHYRLHTKENGDSWDIDPDVAPELISWLTITRGRWENFEIEVPSGQVNAAGEDILVRQRPWRWETQGRLKIPETPFLIGFDGNFGKGPDDVRFLFGTRFDIGKILHTLRIAAAQDSLGQTPQTPQTPPK